MATTIVQPLSMTPGTEKWLSSSLGFANKFKGRAEYDCVPLAHVCKELWDHQAWEQYFQDEPKTWERLCLEVIGTKPGFIDKIIEGVAILEGRGQSGVIPSKRAVTVAEQAEKAKALNGVGAPAENKNAHKKNKHYNIIIDKDKQGTSSTYLTARIARDHPEILERMKAGEFKSVQAAARAAGIAGPVRQITLSVDPEHTARRIIEIKGRAYLSAMLAALKENEAQ